MAKNPTISKTVETLRHDEAKRKNIAPIDHRSIPEDQKLTETPRCLHTTADKLIDELIGRGRVCLNPRASEKLWKLLREREKQGDTARLPPPLILAGWNFSSRSEKQERFHTHLRWAEQHGVLDRATAFLDRLEPGDWFPNSSH